MGKNSFIPLCTLFIRSLLLRLMIPEIRNYSYDLRIQDLDLITLEQWRLRGQLIEVFKYLNEFTTASARGRFDYDLNDRTRNNGAKLLLNISIHQLPNTYTQLK